MNCIKCGREIPEGELVLRPMQPDACTPGTGPRCPRMPKRQKPIPAAAPGLPPKSRRAAQRTESSAKKASASEAEQRRSRKPLIALILVSLLLVASLALHCSKLQ